MGNTQQPGLASQAGPQHTQSHEHSTLRKPSSKDTRWEPQPGSSWTEVAGKPELSYQPSPMGSQLTGWLQKHIHGHGDAEGLAALPGNARQEQRVPSPLGHRLQTHQVEVGAAARSNNSNQPSPDGPWAGMQEQKETHPPILKLRREVK